MSLGFGQIPPQEWEKVKSGSSADIVDAGDYFLKVVDVRHIDPSKSQKGLGAYIVVLEVTEENGEQFLGKKVEARIGYHPDPSTAGDKADGYTRMNEISETKLAQLIDAANTEPMMNDSGMIDSVKTLLKMPSMGPKILGAVMHETYQGKLQQDVGGFRPVSG